MAEIKAAAAAEEAARKQVSCAVAANAGGGDLPRGACVYCDGFM